MPKKNPFALKTGPFQEGETVLISRDPRLGIYLVNSEQLDEFDGFASGGCRAEITEVESRHVTVDVIEGGDEGCTWRMPKHYVSRFPDIRNNLKHLRDLYDPENPYYKEREAKKHGTPATPAQ